MLSPARLVATLTTALLLIGVAACGAEDDDAERSPRSAFERELEALTGVADARVDREAFDTDYWGEEIVVDMDADATAADVTAVLDAFVDRRRSQDGAPQDAHLTLGAGTTDSASDDYGVDAPPIAVPAQRKAGNARVAKVLIAATSAFPGANVSVTSTDWSVRARADGDDPRPAIEAMIATVQGDALLGATKIIDLTAVATTEGAERSIQFSTFEGLTPELLAAWRGVEPTLDAPEFRHLWLSPEWVEVRVRAGEDVAPRDLTTATYGDALWPLLHGILDTVATMPTRTEFVAVNEWHHEPPEDGDGHLEDRFLRIRSGLRPAEDRKGRTWNSEAGDYLTSLGGP